MSDIRVSFVLASFNGAMHIEAQARSILASMGPDDEIVVSDDGSTDQTLQILHAIGDERIRFAPSGPRLGYQRNFQRAIKASRGRFIFFADQDDICLNMRVPASLDALSMYDCVCGDAVVVDQELNQIASSFFALRKARFGAFRLFLRPAVIGATMACRREFVMANMPFPSDVPHDMWLSIRAALQGRLHAEPEAFILYRRHEKALSATGTKRSRNLLRILFERTRLLLALFKQLPREET